MSEVSCRALQLYFEGLTLAGLPRAALAEGSPYALAELEDVRRRIPWDDYADLAERFGALVDDWVIDALGRQYAVMPAFRHIVHVSALLVSREALLGTLMKVNAALLFPLVHTRIETPAPDQLVLRITLPDGAKWSETHCRVSRAVFRDTPPAVGMGDVRWVRYARDGHTAVFTVQFVEQAQLAGEPEPRVLDTLQEVAREAADLRLAVADIQREKAALAAEKRQLEAHVAELTRTRAALEDSEARWRSLAEHAPDVILSTGPDGRITTINRSEHLPVELVLGRHPAELTMSPEDAAEVRQAIDRVLQRGEQVFYVIGGPREGGGRVTWSCHVGPILSQGRIVGATIIARDVTEQQARDDQRRALEREVERAQRIEGIALLAGGVAHDFNNLLFGVSANVDLAQATLPPDDPARVFLDRVKGITRRAGALTSNLLSTAGRGAEVRDPVTLAWLVAETRDHLAATLPDAVTFVAELPSDLPAVLGDPSQLQQVLENLVANSRDALGEGPGTIRVSGRVERGDGHATVELRVSDDGPGMDEEVRSRIFEPFFTTKPKGHGLGLAAARGIVRTHGGALEVWSRPGEGATFVVRLPAFEPADAAVRGPQSCGRSRARGRVLVADDDASVREALIDLLHAQGLDAVGASDGPSALAAWKADPGFTAVVLDLHMPGLGGDRVLDLARRAGLDTPVIVTSARQDQGLLGRLATAGQARFLAKPFDAEALRAALAPVDWCPALDAEADPVAH